MSDAERQKTHISRTKYGPLGPEYDTRWSDLKLEQKAHLHNQAQKKLAAVFGSPVGREVLGYVLQELHFFQAAEDMQDVALQNAAKRILARAGILDAERPDIVIARLTGAHAPGAFTEGDINAQS